MNPEVHFFSLEIHVKWAGIRHEGPEDNEAVLTSERKEDEHSRLPTIFMLVHRGQEEASSQTSILSDEPQNSFKWMALEH